VARAQQRSCAALKTTIAPSRPSLVVVVALLPRRCCTSRSPSPTLAASPSCSLPTMSHSPAWLVSSILFVALCATIAFASDCIPVPCNGTCVRGRALRVLRLCLAISGSFLRPSRCLRTHTRTHTHSWPMRPHCQHLRSAPRLRWLCIGQPSASLLDQPHLRRECVPAARLLGYARLAAAERWCVRAVVMWARSNLHGRHNHTRQQLCLARVAACSMVAAALSRAPTAPAASSATPTPTAAAR